MTVGCGGASEGDTRFERLIANSAVATALTTPHGQFLVVNPAMCETLGYDADTLLRMTWHDVTVPDDLARGMQAAGEILAGRQDSVRMTKQYIHAAGHRIWGDLSLSCMRDADGNVEFFISQIVDITERVALQASQADADARYRRMMENSCVGMSLNTPDGRFVDVNEALCDMLGYDAPTLCTMTWQQVTAPATLEVDIRQTDDLAAGLIDNYRTTKQFIHADGRLVWADLSASCIRDADGQIELFVAQFIDVTVEVELRAQQAEADARFRRLMEDSSVAMALIAPDGRLEVVNQALCELSGYDEATLKSKTWQELSPPENLAEDLEHALDLFSGRLDTFRIVRAPMNANGNRVWMDLSVSCLRNSSGEVEYLVFQGVDISDVVAAEEMLARQEHANRVLADRLRAEIRSAADYVESTLPGDLDGAVEVTSRYLPSLDLGGDRYHYRWLDDDHLKVYLLDVSGHGVRPAFLSLSVHNVIRSGSFSHTTLLNPDRVLDRLNAMFPMEDQGGEYFTIWYGVYQLSTRTLRYASAGHPPGLALSRAGDLVTASSLYTAATPIGMFSDTVYSCASYQVPNGAQLLLYSDGAFELPFAPGTGQPIFLRDFMTQCMEVAASPGWSLDELVSRLRSLSITGDFDDDCALVLLTFP